MKQLFDLTGKKAIVSGGSRGIGKALADALHDAGAEVVVFHNSTPPTCPDAGMYALKCDVSHREEIAAAVDRAAEILGGRIDILINAAGINRRYSLENFPIEEWDRVISTNLNGAAYCLQCVGKYMLRQQYGRVVNLASLCSFVGGQNVGAYVASKGAVAQMTKAFASEWGSRGVRVNAIAPGYIRTDMTQVLQDNEAFSKSVLARIPNGRWGTPEDMVGPVLMLVSDAADYVNGAILPVDGGYLTR